MSVREVHPLAGKPAPASLLVDVARLVTAYYSVRPDPSVLEQRVVFGTSGHRGSSLRAAFNEGHILAVTQAICEYRAAQKITGPLYIGKDSHAASGPAQRTALEVLAANGVEVFLEQNDGFTPTPAISHAILTYNRGRTTGLADGIVVTPSHNPPRDGGFKYNPPHGGPADTDVTDAVQQRANDLIRAKGQGIKSVTFEAARAASTTRAHDYLSAYVGDLSQVVDLEAVRESGIALGVDPLGGASVDYWQRIAEHYRPEQLRGRKVVVVANLEPATLMGVESNGMVLAGSAGDTLALLTLDRDLPPGAKVR